MDAKEYMALLDLIMCCDPWPCDQAGNEQDVKSFANRMAVEKGYESWEDAYNFHVA